jgi:kynurenine 3-monooxygenase
MNIVVIGAGPAGLFLANRLLHLGADCTVHLYDSNSEPTSLETDSRGFGLGLGTRVRHELNQIEGLSDQLAREGIEFTASGLLLIPRRQLCTLLLQQARSAPPNPKANPDSQVTPQFKVHFNAVVTAINLTHREITIEQFTGTKTVEYDLLVGADGIHSTVRRALMQASPEALNYQQRTRPHIWKVLQLPPQSDLQQSPRILRLQTRRSDFGLVFGACLPQKAGRLSALVFWQPSGARDQINPYGISTVEALQHLWQDMAPKAWSTLQLDHAQATAFLTSQPGHEYWSQCHVYHNTAGQAVLIGDAAHGMFSLLGQGCTAAIADAAALSALIEQYSEQWSIVLPEFSRQQVKEGHAVSDLSLLALLFYDRWLGLLYKVATVIWVFILRQPSIFAQINREDATYVQVLQKNHLWVRLAQQIWTVERD